MLLPMSRKERRKNKLLVQLAQEEQEGRFQIILLEGDPPGILKQKLQVSLRVHQNRAVRVVRPVVMAVLLSMLHVQNLKNCPQNERQREQLNSRNP